MKLLNRLSRVTCWLILVLLVQTTAAPALADPPPGGDLPLNVIDPPISVPPMAYQPPPDANELSDFVPPNAVVLEIPIDLPGGPITPTVEPTPTVFPMFLSIERWFSRSFREGAWGEKKTIIGKLSTRSLPNDRRDVVSRGVRVESNEGGV